MKTFGHTWGNFQQASVLNYIPSILRDGNTFEYIDVTEAEKCIVKDGSNRVSTLKDYFGVGPNLTQTTDGKKPVLTSEGLTFDGISQAIRSGAATLPQPCTIYILFKQNAWGSNKVIFDGGTSTNTVLIQLSTGPNGLRVGAGTLMPANIDMPLEKFCIITVVFDGANSYYQVDNLPPVTGNWGAGSPNGFTLGAYAAIETGFSNITVKAAIVRKINDTDTSKAIIKSNLLSKHKINYPITKVNLIAISGQSNAMGFLPDTTLPNGYYGNVEKVKIYLKSITGDNFQRKNVYTNCGDQLISATPSLHGWSAEQSAAHELLTNNEDTLIVKSFYDGGRIVRWDAGLAPFTDLVDGIKKALDKNDPLLTSYPTPTLRSFLWMQGESDAIGGVTTASYEASLRSLISRLRSSDSRLSNMQFVMVKLSDRMTYAGMTVTTRGNINTAMSNVVADTANTVIIDPDIIAGTAFRADNLHYTSASLLLIGSKWKTLMA